MSGLQINDLTKILNKKHARNVLRSHAFKSVRKLDVACSNILTKLGQCDAHPYSRLLVPYLDF